jgi:hypothetical protein
MSEVFTSKKRKFVAQIHKRKIFRYFHILCSFVGNKERRLSEETLYMQGTLEEAFEEGKMLAMQATQKCS